MATILASRVSPSLRCSSHGRRSPVTGPVVCCQPRVSCSPRAFYRNGWNGAWDESSADAMKELLNDLAKQWKDNEAAVGGGFFWPGGGYVYGSQSCKPPGSTSATSTTGKQQHSGSSSADPCCPRLPLDVADTGDFYLLFADVPGLAKKDLSIKLSKDRVLKVAGVRKAPWHLQEESQSASPPADQQGQEGQGVSSTTTQKQGKQGLSPLQRERVFGAFERKWELPEDADAEGISAKVAEGVLTITVPKKQPQPEEDDSQDILIS